MFGSKSSHKETHQPKDTGGTNCGRSRRWQPFSNRVCLSAARVLIEGSGNSSADASDSLCPQIRQLLEESSIAEATSEVACGDKQSTDAGDVPKKDGKDTQQKASRRWKSLEQGRHVVLPKRGVVIDEMVSGADAPGDVQDTQEPSLVRKLHCAEVVAEPIVKLRRLTRKQAAPHFAAAPRVQVAIVDPNVVAGQTKKKKQRKTFRPSNFCQGRSVQEPCIFSTAQPGLPARRGWKFCDAEQMSAAMLDLQARSTLMRSFKQLTPEMREKALERIPEDFRRWARKKAVKSDRCIGRSASDPCVYSASLLSHAVQTQGRADRCLLCDHVSVGEACEMVTGRWKIRKLLNKMGTQIRKKALDDRIPSKHRDKFLDVLEEAEPPEVARRCSRKRPAAATAELPPRALVPMPVVTIEHNKAKSDWTRPLAHRGTLRVEVTPEEKAEYRQDVLDDRVQARRCLSMPPRRHARGAEVSNTTGLPRLSADIEHWVRFSAWAQCQECGLMLPRDMTPKTRQPGTSPTGAPRICSRYSSKSLRQKTCQNRCGTCRRKRSQIAAERSARNSVGAIGNTCRWCASLGTGCL